MNLNFWRQTNWRWCRSLALAALVSNMTGCIILPVPVSYHTHGSRKNLRSEDTQWLVPGQTTRAQVVLRLGEPDEIEDDDSRLVYRWEKIYLQVWVAVGGGYSGAAGPTDYGRDYALELTFDLRGALINQALHESEFETKATHTF